MSALKKNFKKLIITSLAITAISPLANADKRIITTNEHMYESVNIIQKKRNGSRQVGLAFGCDPLATADWLKVKVRPLNSNKDHKTYDKFEKNLSCPQLQPEKFWLMEYTYDELVDFADSTNEKGVSIKLQYKQVGGNKDSWAHLSITKNANGKIVITKNDNGTSAAHLSGTRPATAYFYGVGAAGDATLRYFDITNVKSGDYY
ncbi:hypothetical protein [Spartinivicinus poritis]|uniref:Uncharacterized protein n=1 Tax=Spartinivicinus poritis TaxID=2994640 RepID=A0ABT5UK35_9GAMM|nr:hypothetical protein [Spartinivicinus sp. A2-2]MDE1465867.1 hypothetical protein [Spartinivicinus sp. A2-2]